MNVSLSTPVLPSLRRVRWLAAGVFLFAFSLSHAAAPSAAALDVNRAHGATAHGD
jgi:hypothetical protein